MSPLVLALVIAGGFSFLAWILSLITGDTSQVDRLWSIVPVVYTWVFALEAHLANARLDVMAVVVLVWGARLTFNFARKGGYSGVEDYRWAVLRQRMSKVQFQVFNLFFIVLYQNALLLAITLPAYTAFQHRAGNSFGVGDVILTLLFLTGTALETTADQQQWNFQQQKHADIAAGRKPQPRFIQSGLFRFSRHPNYFFDQLQWWTIFLFGAVAAGSLWQWTVAGPFLLSVLFVGSVKFTEEISLSRYPEYADYQATTSPQIPWFPRAASKEATAF